MAISTSRSEFIEMVERFGTSATSRTLGYYSPSEVTRRLARMKGSHPINKAHEAPHPERSHPARAAVALTDGIAFVGSDAHYWPQAEPTTAHRAFVALMGDLHPDLVILNGDVIDAPRISVHPSIGWESRPSVAAEIEAAKMRLAEIEEAAPAAQLFWTLGNHDMRFETYLAKVAPQYEGLQGIHLKDHFSARWQPAWSCWLNGGDVVVKHRWKGGVHAAHNNTVGAGVSMVTGHLHSLKVTPYTDYRGTRWGVDTGTLAVPGGPQFINYTEDNPTNWRAGFVVLTFAAGQLLWPEVVHVVDEDDGLVSFRGELLRV